ncbi:MAG: small basic family protein [Clostridiales bacterium]|nr:small basic family protein [Clostridiales bacterium]
MLLMVMGAILGVLIGIGMPITIPAKYSIYVAVAILAAMDTVCGGIVAKLKGNFNLSIFLSGFFLNAILAAVLTYIGDKIGIQLYFAAIVAFGNRMFFNFGTMRRIMIKKYWNKKDDSLTVAE